MDCFFKSTNYKNDGVVNLQSVRDSFYDSSLELQKMHNIWSIIIDVSSLIRGGIRWGSVYMSI